MAYQVYFAELSEENKALTMTLLRFKEEAGTIEPDEATLLAELRGSPTPWPQTMAADEPQPRSYGRNNGGSAAGGGSAARSAAGGGSARRNSRRGSSNGRQFRGSDRGGAAAD